MRITAITAAGLRGATPEGGWQEELRQDDVVHTLVAVHTDEGLVGVGSVFTTEDLVRGALDVLRPLLLGANALEPEPVSCSDLRDHEPGARLVWRGVRG